ncbi:hypothetical protein ABPG74_003446 [Tetrahymena malaccensis]
MNFDNSQQSNAFNAIVRNKEKANTQKFDSNPQPFDLIDISKVGQIDKQDESFLDKQRIISIQDQNQSIITNNQPNVIQSSKTITMQLSDIVKRVRLRQAAKKLVNSTRSRMLTNMKTHQYSLINDKSQDFTDLKKDFFQNSIFFFSISRDSKWVLAKKLIQQFVFFLQKIPVVNPSSRKKYFWDMYFWRGNQQTNQEEEEKMINQLPDYLRNELLIESNKIVLRDSLIFQNNFSEEVIHATIPLIREINFTPLEVIYTENDENIDRSIYFVQEGIVEVYLEVIEHQQTGQGSIQKSNKIIKRFKKGDCFGEIEFFTDGNRQMNVRSLSFSTLLKINRSDFINTIKNFPTDYEQFCYIKDRLIFQNDYSKISHKCMSCKSENHRIGYCPYLHFVPNKPKLFAILNKTNDQQRNESSPSQILNRKRQRYRLFPQQILTLVNNYVQINEELIEEFNEKYLSFDISKCDVCSNLVNLQPANQQYLHSNSNQAAANPLLNLCTTKNNFSNEGNQLAKQKTDQGRSGKCRVNKLNDCFADQKIQSFQQQFQNNNISIHSCQQIEDQQPQKVIYQRAAGKQQSKISVGILEGKDQQENYSPKDYKLQPISLIKQKSTNIEQNTFCNQVFQNNPQLINQFMQNQNGIYSNMNCQPSIDFDNQEQISLQTKINKQIANNFIQATQNYNLNNQNNQLQNKIQSMLNMEQDQNQRDDIYLRKLSMFYTFEDVLNIYNSQNNQQNFHIKKLFFDIFYGEFEKMKVYELYYPLNNFQYVIKQIHMDSNQKKKMRLKLLEQQRQNMNKIIMKKKKKNGGRASVNITTADYQVVKLLVDKFEQENKEMKSIKGSQILPNNSGVNSNIYMNNININSSPQFNNRRNSMTNSLVNYKTQKSVKQMDKINFQDFENENQDAQNISKSILTQNQTIFNSKQNQSPQNLSLSSSAAIRDSQGSSQVYDIYDKQQLDSQQQNQEFKFSANQSKKQQQQKIQNQISQNEIQIFLNIENNLSPPLKEKSALNNQHSEIPDIQMLTFGDRNDNNALKKNISNAALIMRKQSINTMKVKDCFQSNLVVQDYQENDILSSPNDIKLSRDNKSYLDGQQQIDSKQIDIYPKLLQIVKKIKLIEISRIIIEKTRSRMLKNIKAHQYEFINDKSQDFSDLQKGNKQKLTFLSISQQHSLIFKKFQLLLKIISSLPILLIAHACACLWIICGRLSMKYLDASWIQTQNLQNQSWYQQYLEAFYFCSVTMATVGYGDIVPKSTIEIGFCIVMVFFASAVFGFAVNTIQSILYDFTKNEKLLTQNLVIIKSYLHKKSINDNLSKDVTEYLEYYLRANQESNQQQEENLIKQLPDSLRNDLLIESNKIVLRDCQIFQNYFSEDVIRATTPIIQEKHYTPHEHIFMEGENNQDQCIYFVQEGVIEMYIDSTNYFDEKVGGKDRFKTIKRFKKGDYFGELQFFINENKGMNVRSINFSTLLKIKRQEFIQILKKFPQDYEQFCFIKDSLIMQQTYEKLYQKCPSCYKSNHLLEACPFLHYYPRKYKVLAQQNISQYQIRNKEYQRTVKRKMNNFKLNEDIAIEYIEFNQESLYYYGEKYLSFNFAKCDMCTQFHKCLSYNNKRKEVHSQLDKSQFDHENLSNQIQNNISSQNNIYQSHFQNIKNKETVLQTDNNTSSSSLNQIHDDQGFQYKFNKFKSLYTRTQNSKSIENLDYAEIASSSKQIKSQLQQSKQKNMKKNIDNENIRRSSLNTSAIQGSFNSHIQVSNTYIQQKNGSSLKILGVQQQPYHDTDNYYNEQLYPQYVYNTPSIQAINNGMYESTNYAHYQDSAKIIRNQSQSAIPQKDLHKNDQQQHIQRIFFDQFLGQFEKMKIFLLYYPLNNYHYVISQTRQDPNQKCKLRAEILNIQRQRQNKIAQTKQLRNFKQGSRGQNIQQNKIIKKLLDKYEFQGRESISQNIDESISFQIISNQNLLLRRNRESTIQSPQLSQIQKEKYQIANNSENNIQLYNEENNNSSIIQENNQKFKKSFSLFKKNVSQQNEDLNQQSSYAKTNQNDSENNNISIQNAISDVPSNKQLNSYQIIENLSKIKNSQISIQNNQEISYNTINSPPKQEQQVLSLKCIQNTKYSLYQYNQNEGNTTQKHEGNTTQKH